MQKAHTCPLPSLVEGSLLMRKGRGPTELLTLKASMDGKTKRALLEYSQPLPPGFKQFLDSASQVAGLQIELRSSENLRQVSPTVAKLPTQS
ncbi:hypothetical protein AAY473_017656 [Plecturocebus cupreus]